MNMPVKVSNALLRWLGLFASMCIGYWVAGQREPKDGWYYFVTALVVTLVVWAIYCALIYSLAFIWSRLVKKNEATN
jgi:hypothetical protein